MTDNGDPGADDGDADVARGDGRLHDAERVAEEWGEKAARWLARTTERAREEAEDVWAEAQEKRRQL
jgi:hypothetical protein